MNSWFRSLLLLGSLFLFAGSQVSSARIQSGQATAPKSDAPPAKATLKPPESLTSAEFAKLSRSLSEEGGYFFSDNFTSNETSYLHIVDKLKELAAPGGAYLGVGPEQNYTYIAKLRPQIVFLLDIRRQAIIQHLMYKAIFHLSSTRAQFLARLLSRPLPKETTLGATASLTDMLAYVGKTPADDKTYAANLATLQKTIQEDFQFPLTERDKASLDYVYKSFRTDGLEIAFRMDGAWSNYFPTLQEMLTQTDLRGRNRNFLANTEDYDFLRGLHAKNLIIPVVGDFGGKQAIVQIGEYLRQHGLTVTAFYTSNVEQYLFDGAGFAAFAGNIGKLPLTEKSLFIRAVFNMRYSHPARLPGHLSTTLLQPMQVFLTDFAAGKYESYYELITTHYIAP